MGEFKLEQLGEKTYWIKNQPNIGIYVTAPGRVALIDTGYGRDAEALDQVLMDNGWVPSFIANTHSHLDHMHANHYFMAKYGIPAYCTAEEIAFDNYSEFEAVFMTGGYPSERLRNMFAHKHPVGMTDIAGASLAGLEWIELPGHTLSQLGYRTDDNVLFAGDSFLGLHYLSQSNFGLIYRVDKFLESLETLRVCDAKVVVPGHGRLVTDIGETVDANIANINRHLDMVVDCCQSWAGFDEIFSVMAGTYGLPEDVGYYAMSTSTTRSYITYLEDTGRLEMSVIDHVQKWRAR